MSVDQTYGHQDVHEWPELYRMAGRRLGAHHDFDVRRYRFSVEHAGGWLLPPKSVVWTRHVPIYTMGDIAAAPAFALLGALGSEPLLREDMRLIPQFPPPPAPPTTLFDVTLARYTNELAEKLYARATWLDGLGGTTRTWPKSDPGTTGDAVCQAAREAGLLPGWGHCLGATSVPHALQVYGPVMLGLPWHDGMDIPDPDGTIHLDGPVRGGNMLLCREYQHGETGADSWFWLDGQWGTDYGINGRVRISADALWELFTRGAHGIVIKTGNPRA